MMRTLIPWVWFGFLSLYAQEGATALDLPYGAYTYEVTPGTLGDHLLTYARARWLSYRNHIPLIVRPFPFSDQLSLHRVGLGSDQISRTAWEQRHSLDRDPFISLPGPGEIVEVPYFPESRSLTALCLTWVPFFQVDWSDLAFLQDLRIGICPEKSLSEAFLPADRLCVAIHWRRTRSGTNLCLKRPPPTSHYFQRELQRLLRVAGGRRLYIHLFTDDPYPGELLEQLQEWAQGFDADLEWGTRRPGIPASSSILEDLFYMARFDVLIRAESSFALIAARIGDIALEIAPADSGALPPSIPPSHWRLRPGISLDALLDGWRVRWAGY